MIPNNVQPRPDFYGPVQRCADCESRILDETGGRRQLRLPSVPEAAELERMGLYRRGDYLPWFGPAFMCAHCCEKWRASAERIHRWLDSRE
jgi:hypothetical protein